MNSVSLNNENKGLVNARMLILVLFIVSIVMVFAGLTSAYIVRRAEGNWLEFNLPDMFKLSTLVILVSSATLIISQFLLKKGRIGQVRLLIGLSFILGLMFLVFQYQSWVEIYNYELVPGPDGQLFGIVFGGRYANPSGSFLYVLSGLHFVHIIGGLIFVGVVLAMSFRNNVESLKRWLEMCSIFWHFLGALWIYLYVFLIVYH